jgi:hypothetical protein
MGSALAITLSPPLAKGAKIAVRISYSTTREGTALGWLDKDQTAGKKFDYLFSQCQAVSSLYTRSPIFHNYTSFCLPTLIYSRSMHGRLLRCKVRSLCPSGTGGLILSPLIEDSPSVKIASRPRLIYITIDLI